MKFNNCRIPEEVNKTRHEMALQQEGVKLASSNCCYLPLSRVCTWSASIPFTPGTPTKTTCTCVTKKTCACCPGSASSSKCVYIYIYICYCLCWPVLILSHPPACLFSLQQIWPVHKGHWPARRGKAASVLPVSDWQVLPGNSEVVKMRRGDRAQTENNSQHFCAHITSDSVYINIYSKCISKILL